MTTNQRGFTLVEVVIAIALFALIALVGWQLVEQLQTTQVRGDAVSQQQSELLILHSNLMSDAQLLAPRVLGEQLMSATDQSLRFYVRSGPDVIHTTAVEESSPPPPIRLVSYELIEGQLVRSVRADSPAGDAQSFRASGAIAPSGATGAQSSAVLISEVSDLSFNLLEFTPQQLQSGAAAQQGSGRARPTFEGAPAQVLVDFTYQGLEYHWVFAIPAYGLLSDGVSSE